MADPLDNPTEIAKAALKALDDRDEEAGLALTRTGRARFPADARLWQIEGLLHRQRDDLGAAIEAFAQADALAPNDAKIVHGHAVARAEGGLRAIDQFARARQLAPGDLSVVSGRVSALVSQGDLATAIEGLELMLHGQPDWLDGLASLAQLRWQSGERTGFARGFEAALGLAPANANLWNNYIFVLLHAEQFADALAVIDRARGAVGETLVLQWSEAACCSEVGDHKRADRGFEPIRETRDVATQLRRVRHLLRTDRSIEAAAECERWIGTPAANQFWPYLALAWRLLGDPRWGWLEGDLRLVGVYDIAERLPDLAQLAETLRALHNVPGQPLVQSVRGGTQSWGNLLSHVDPTIRQLRAALAETVAEYAAQLPADPTHPFLSAARSPIRFAASWSVRLSASGHHSNHVHPMGWISSALYISLPLGVGQSEGSDQAGWLTLGAPPRELGLDLAPFRSVEPKPGRLVLFPSIMWHGTVPFASGERLTVAFDVERPG